MGSCPPVTEEERMLAHARSRRMYQSDLESNMATAERRGVLSVAKNMIAGGELDDKIIEYTGLSITEINQLRV